MNLDNLHCFIACSNRRIRQRTIEPAARRAAVVLRVMLLDARMRIDRIGGFERTHHDLKRDAEDRARLYIRSIRHGN